MMKTVELVSFSGEMVSTVTEEDELVADAAGGRLAAEKVSGGVFR